MHFISVQVVDVIFKQCPFSSQSMFQGSCFLVISFTYDNFMSLCELKFMLLLQQAIFERFDRDRSGKIDSMELRDALYSLGYAIPPSVLQVLISRYDDGSGRRVELNFDSFVQ